ncbi:hypothetical protein BDP27DRAFT_1429074 [Rhodocollybia butyracea]|uniref:DUF6570 domain-containing protein n=1 Tax=Rhodocollybia butyracea TaxID=206335 RepID=A0A9P5PAF8_9AGAR|nr:hypothetical protein BDP27DRAFT_1429074 [Rhodocollybia butyracea]
MAESLLVPQDITENLLQTLTVKEIIHIVALSTPRIQIPTRYRNQKSSLITYIIHNRSESVFQSFCRHFNSQKGHNLNRKRARATDTSGSSSRKAICADHSPDSDSGGNGEISVAAGEFMEVLTPAEIRKCHQAFYRATSNAMVKPVTCGVCARENDLHDPPSSIRRIPLSNIPNGARLIPHTAHPQHTLYDGKLLESAGVIQTPNGEVLVSICKECWQELEGAKDLPPKFSLANDMWIGEIPFELQGLTFPEQLLIAQLYPRVYVFKLFPKKIQGKRDATTLQSAMRGNVTTFELDNPGIAAMLEGNMML